MKLKQKHFYLLRILMLSAILRGARWGGGGWLMPRPEGASCREPTNDNEASKVSRLFISPPADN